MKISKFKEMFEEMVIKKDASLIPHYYHPEFVLYANGKEMDYPAYLELHEEIYKTPITYKVDYDEVTLLEQDDKVAGRVYITTKQPNESPKEIEVILITQYKDDKIYRIWELTYPDWSQMPDFELPQSKG